MNEFAMEIDLAALIAKTHELAVVGGHQFASKEHLFRALCESEGVKSFMKDHAPNQRAMNLVLEQLEADLPLRKPTQTDPIFSIGVEEAINKGLEMHKVNFEAMPELFILQALFEDEDGSIDYVMRAGGVRAVHFVDLQGNTPRAALAFEASPVESEPCVGREHEILRLRQIIGRKDIRNALVVGSAGSGKSALMRGLAAHLEGDDKWPRLWHVTPHWSAGTLDFGTGSDFAASSPMLEAAKSENAVLVLENISLQGEREAHKIEHFLDSIFSSGVPLLMAVRPQVQQQLQKIPSLAGRMHTLHLEEPNEDDLQRVIKMHLPALERHHGVRYEAAALKQAPQLARSWRKDLAQPGLSLSFLDEVGSAAVLSGKESVSARELRQVARPAPKTRAESEKLPLRQRLSERVRGQEAAVRRVAEAAELHLAGLRDASRTAGAFLFVGPTGVGKTELARALADELGVALTRFDMSEFAERHAISRLIGSPPGYVGFERGGSLISAILKHPNGVLLFDEIEKAHPDVYALFLQLMDHATVTDQSGNEANASGCFVLFTSNAGAAGADEAGVGFFTAESDDQCRQQIVARAVKTTFTPEFRGRLDGVLQFSPLSEEDVLLVVDKFVGELSERLSDQDVKLSAPPSVRKWLAKRGHSPTLGARPLARVVEQKLALPAARLLLEHEARPLKLQARVKGEELKLSVVK